MRTAAVIIAAWLVIAFAVVRFIHGTSRRRDHIDRLARATPVTATQPTRRPYRAPALGHHQAN